MQSKVTTVQQYLAELSADRRSAIKNVRSVVLKNIDPVFEEGMQSGMIECSVLQRRDQSIRGPRLWRSAAAACQNGSHVEFIPKSLSSRSCC